MKLRRLLVLLIAVALLRCAVPAYAADPHPAQAIADELTAQGVDLKLETQGKNFVIHACLKEKHGDEILAKVASLPNVVSLDAGGSKITDEGVKILAYIPGLQNLQLYDTAITDAALPVLAAYNSQLSDLDLSRTAVTDQGIAQLAALRNLRILRLNGTAATDAVLPPLSKLRRLQKLSLLNTKVTAKAVADFELHTFAVDRFSSPAYLVQRASVTVYYDK